MPGAHFRLFLKKMAVPVPLLTLVTYRKDLFQLGRQVPKCGAQKFWRNAGFTHRR